MCGRYYRNFDIRQMAEHFRAEPAAGELLPSAPAYKAAPTSNQPVIRAARHTDKYEIVRMRWGLVGHNSTAFDSKHATFNACAETIGRNPFWRSLFRRRCLVPLGGFYAWRKPDKVPFRFFLPGEPVFALAGIWDAWERPGDGFWLQSYSIITTEANELVIPIQDRMPVILRPEDYPRWLSRSDPERPPVDLLRPYDAARMALAPAHTLSSEWPLPIRR